MLRSRRPYASSRSPIPRARCCYSCFVPPQRQPAVAVLGCKTLFPHAQTLRTWGATLLPHAAGPLFLRSEQVPERRIVPQRPQRWVEVHDPALRIPLGERLLHQRDRGFALTQHGVDPTSPHRVPAIQIPAAHRLQRPVEAERFIALALARHHYAEKAQEGQMIGLVTRDGGHPAHAGGVACVNPLRREALEQAPCGVGLSGDVVRERETEPRSEEHTSELQSPCNLVCRLLLEKKKKKRRDRSYA